MNDSKEIMGFEYNFQSGFGNLNDTADSIGSLFGFGPEDRNSVTARAQSEITAFAQEVMLTVNATGIDSAIEKVNVKLKYEQNALRTFKSSNSKHMARMWIEALTKLLLSLKTQKNKPKATEVFASTVSGVKPNQASMGYIALGIMALYLFSKKGKAQVKRLY